MTLNTYIGQKKALIFPVMCDGYLQIDHSQEIAGVNHGIFGYNDSFTIEAIITPYDINGLGYKFADTNNPAGASGVTNSVKTMPAVQTYNTTVTSYQSHLYRNQTSRITDKMIIFHSDSVELYLLNSTLTNQNQPAEYKIGFKVKLGATTQTLESDAIFTSKVLQYKNSATVAYESRDDTITTTPAAANVNTHTAGQNNFEMTGANDADNYFFVGQELFILSSGVPTSIGKVTAVDSSGKTVTLNAVVADSIASTNLLTHADREAPYLLSSAHVAATYDIANGRMNIYYNGELLTSVKHSNFGSDFAIEPEDAYLGQDPSVGSSTQFMGELHEFAFLKEVKTEYNSLHTLAPNYRNILLYYQFGEPDL